MIAEVAHRRYDDYWRPSRVRDELKNYHAHIALARPPQEDWPQKRGRHRALDGEKHPVEVLADLDRALRWLSQLECDPAAASTIWSVYCDPRYHRETISMRVILVAAEEGITESGVYKRLDRGIEAMAKYLGEDVLYPYRKRSNEELDALEMHGDGIERGAQDRDV